MMRAAIVGLGWWGKTLVEAVSGVSDKIQFVAATTRSLSDDAKKFSKEHNLDLRDSYENIIADPDIDAVVLVTPLLLCHFCLKLQQNECTDLRIILLGKKFHTLF